MCAIEAGKRGARVAVLEHAEKLGKKILISGGGRCNFTNIYTDAENFISNNPHFAKSALSRYAPTDFVALVEKHTIAFHEKKLGQLFCDGSAREIVAMLERECESAAADIFLSVNIDNVKRDDGFVVSAGDREFRSPKLIVATGGLSIPKIGASSFGFDLARRFGLAVIQPFPALVPILLSNSDRSAYCDLSGISADVIASCAGQNFREKMLITHRGLSGPAILQISSYWMDRRSKGDSGLPIRIDLAPGSNPAKALQDVPDRNPKTLMSAVASVLPARLTERWIEKNPPIGWSNQALDDFERRIHAWEIVPSGSEGYEKAEVTGGGVDTHELSAKTMESKKIPGLYFIGEVVDVTGHLGGFNFQWAWASGAAAGRSLK
jgi:predicted Rossmann fold flavoprotein